VTTRLQYALSKKDNAFFWHPPNGEPNIGDYLAFETVNYCLNLFDKDPSQIINGKLLSIGSVLHFADTGDCIWGAGKNGKIDESNHHFTQLDVRAVRGPLTRDYLNSKNIKCPDVFGDPGILALLIYPEKMLLPGGPTKDFVIVPQLNNNMEKYNEFTNLTISPRSMPANFIRQLLEGKKVISSSLHGLILAEAYGRDAVYYNSGSGETSFKYLDYYRGTGRDKLVATNSIREAMDTIVVGISNIEDLQQKLVSSFPNDKYHS
jgi:pyruvyltransferase